MSGTEETEDRQVASKTRIVLRPIGSPLPLGFLGLVGATISLAGIQLGWVPANQHATVGLVMITFVFPLQLISSIFGFLSRDTVAGTGMGILAGTWLTIGIVTYQMPVTMGNRALALLLFVSAAAMLSPVSAAATGKLVPAIIMALAALRFALTGLYQWFGSPWSHVSAWEGIVLACIALYGALGLELEDVLRRRALPMGRRGAGRRALDGSLTDEIHLLGREAGVREQL